MFARTLLVAGGLVPTLTGAAAAEAVVTGTVTRVDPPASVVVLQDGQMIRVPGGTVLINGQPVAVTTVQPGSQVAIQNGQVVTYQNGQYVVAGTTSPYEVSGRVVQIDRVENVLVLDGLRPIALTPDMQIFQDGHQVALESVRPGALATVRSVSPMAASNRKRDRSAAVAPATTTVVTPTPETVTVVTTPNAPAPGAVVAAPSVTVPTTAVPTGPVAYAGTVARVDADGIMLTDGRRVPMTSQSVVLVNNQPVAMSALKPGTSVVIYPNGSPAASAAGTTIVSTYPSAGYPWSR